MPTSHEGEYVEWGKHATSENGKRILRLWERAHDADPDSPDMVPWLRATTSGVQIPASLKVIRPGQDRTLHPVVQPGANFRGAKIASLVSDKS